jgi:hypothetical protein
VSLGGVCHLCSLRSLRPASLRRRRADPSLVEKQRKAIAKANPGEALLSRLAKPAKGSPAAKKAAATVAGKKAGAKGADKVSRAKKAAAKPQAMDVDKAPKPKPKEAAPKAQPKTQADLDEEMKAYERQRRFA